VASATLELPAPVWSTSDAGRPELNRSSSVTRMMLLMISTVRTGYLPEAVSADNITADVPS
jgi:hypothetical protein